MRFQVAKDWNTELYVLSRTHFLDTTSETATESRRKRELRIVWDRAHAAVCVQ